MPFFEHDAIRFHFRDTGAGLPVVFQHGLGGDVDQPFGLFVPPAGFRLLAMDCRGHGRTEPIGDPARIGIETFADDLLAFLDHLELPQAIVGGISMGASVALNFTLRFPQRVIGLVQSRPAWLAAPNAENAGWFGDIARLIRAHGAKEGRLLFRRSPRYQQLSVESPGVAQSLLGQFDKPRAEETVVILERIPRDAPCHRLEQLAEIRVPTLVMANRQDPVHPFEFGQVIAKSIPGAEFQEIAAKSVSVERHQQDVQKYLGGFLQRHFGSMDGDG